MINRTLILGFLFCFFLVPVFEAHCQEKGFRLEIISSQPGPLDKRIHDLSENLYQDTIHILNTIKELRNTFHSKGFLAAGLDSLTFTGTLARAYFSPGIEYKWGRLVGDQLNAREVSLIKRRGGLKSGRVLTVEQIFAVRSVLVSEYENIGYPYVSVKFDSISFNEGILDAAVIVDRGPFILIDSIVIRTEDIISRKVLEQITGLKKGQPYSEKKIERAGEFMGNSLVIKPALPVEVGFIKDKAWVYLSPEKRMSNSIDGILGLVPGANNPAGLSFTGSLDLKLSNVLKQAETFSLMWKSPGNSSQRLETEIEMPYFLGWPVGFYTEFELFRKDSSYLNTDWSAGIQAALSPDNRIGFFYRTKASNVLLRQAVGEYSDMAAKIYGVRWNLQKVENPVNPARGIIVSAELGAGNKNQANQENDVEGSVYWEGQGTADFYIPLGKSWLINLGAGGGYIRGGEIYQNEKFKIGGINSLRGFDEESILADSYFIGTFELRYLISRNSNFHIFSDAGSWWSLNNESRTNESPLGLGLGMSFETIAGIILLDYAIGSSGSIPFSIRNGKIHLGFKSIF